MDLMETEAALRVPLDGFVMRLRRPELESVAAGLRELDTSAEGDLIILAAAVRHLPPKDRAPVWELAVRRYGRHKPVAQAAAEIGMDEIVAADLLDRFAQTLADVRPRE